MNTQTCEHETAVAMHSRTDYTYMFCTHRCQQPFVMQRQTDGTYRRRNDVARFFIEREQKAEVEP